MHSRNVSVYYRILTVCSRIFVTGSGLMATKRPAGDDSPLPQAKKPLIGLPPLHVPAATCQEDLDIKVLQVSH